MLLELENVSARRGRLEVLHGVSIQVDRGQICSLVGSNGAGKTTLIETVSGLLRPTSGRILLDGRLVNGIPAYQRVGLGLMHVPEGRWLFSEMTVEENLRLGAFSVHNRDRIRMRLAEVMDLFPQLRDRRSQLAATMSGGEQQMVAIGRALMSDPKLLILDEPSLGLAPVIVKDILKVIQRVREAGVSVLIVEQNVRDVLSLSDMAHVLENGELLIQGTGDALKSDPRVVAAYLGQ